MGVSNLGQALKAGPFRDMVIAAIVFTLPNITPELAGWLQGFTPIVAFYIAASHGPGRGNAIIVKAFCIAAGLTALAGSLQSLLFTMALVPLGFSLAHSARLRLSAERAAFFGMGVLVAGYLAYWLATFTLTGLNPYQVLSDGLQNGLRQWGEAYMALGKSEGWNAEALHNLEQLVQQATTYLPTFLPGILIITLLCQVWFNLTLGSFLLRKTVPGVIPWPEMPSWRLPEHLVWALISGAIAIFLPWEDIKLIGINLLMIICTLYLFQGFSVLAFLFRKWRVPPGLRALMYLLLLLQGYGLLVVSGIGLADVWANFGKPRNQDEGSI